MQAETYISQARRKLIIKRSWYVWAAAGAAATLWIAAILLPPVAAAAGDKWLAQGVYSFFGLICHQMPSRSFFIFGHQMGVCSRCFGVYSGLLAGVLAYPLWRRIENTDPLPRFWLFAAMIPIGLDWSLTILGIWENTFTTRFVSGSILGIACATYILPAAVETVTVRIASRPGTATGIH